MLDEGLKISTISPQNKRRAVHFFMKTKKNNKGFEVYVLDIPESGKILKGNTRLDPWFLEDLKTAFGEGFAENDEASFSLQLIRCKRDLDLFGELHYSCHLTCDRCLASFQKHGDISLQTHFSPLHEKSKAGKFDQDELAKEDEAFRYYEGDTFDLADLLLQEIYLDQPMTSICTPSCLGLCPKCGQNLNEKACSCSEKKVDPRFEALKLLKIKEK